MNLHYTYHIAQASLAKHGSLVDMLDHGGLAGTDVMILSRSSRNCNVTGIDSHELQGLHIVQCAALVENHCIVNIIMNEYACYDKWHTIHCSGQIEWFKNTVDDRSVQVGDQQRICTLDGYSMPLVCKSGVMYLTLMEKPSNEILERYPSVQLTGGPHEWDPSVLDHAYPSHDGEATWSTDPNERFQFDPNFDEFGDYTQKPIETLNILNDSTQHLTTLPTIQANKFVLCSQTPNYEKLRP